MRAGTALGSAERADGSADSRYGAADRRIPRIPTCGAVAEKDRVANRAARSHAARHSEGAVRSSRMDLRDEVRGASRAGG